MVGPTVSILYRRIFIYIYVVFFLKISVLYNMKVLNNMKVLKSVRISEEEALLQEALGALKRYRIKFIYAERPRHKYFYIFAPNMATLRDYAIYFFPKENRGLDKEEIYIRELELYDAGFPPPHTVVSVNNDTG